MTRISARGILAAWERGEALHPVDRALVLLAAADPGTPAEDLAALSLGERDARLVALRERSFGEQLACRADCRRCGESLELTLSTADLTAQQAPAELAPPLEMVSGGRRFRFRPINSLDLAAIAACADSADARRLLAERVLLDADPAELTPALVDELAVRLAQADPLAEVLLTLTCPGCGLTQELLFDIASYLWTEVAAEAQRLLRDVDTLARAYGWREADILDMSAARRRLYVEMVS